MTSRLEGFKNRCTARGVRMHVAAALLVLGAQSIASQATALTLVGRETILNGSALVGYANVYYESGILNANDGSLTSSFADVLTASGVADGEYQGTPVTGAASFSAAQAFNFGANGITASGEAGAETTADYAYMSAGARATSTLKLTFTLDAATPFSLGGALITGGTPAPATVQLSCLSACSAEFWRFTSTGAFYAAGTLNAGTWLLYANAGPAIVNSNNLRLASFDLALAVPEPQLAMLLGVGLGGLTQLGRRRRARRGVARPIAAAMSIAVPPRPSGTSISSILSAPHCGRQRKLSMTSRLDGLANRWKTWGIAFSRGALFLLGLSAVPAHASDGVLEISQTCAVQTGCFSGDSAGFPVTIDGTAGDSYQLTSDLIVPDENTSGISFAQPASSNSSIDLKGFSIIRAACVGTNPGCTPATGSGSGIEITNAVIRGISVQNGNIIGMGAYGVSLGDHASVKGLRVRWNRLAGISVTIDSLVTDCTATQNNGGGIVATTSATITNNSVYQNAINGISVSFGSVVSHNVASQSFIDGINAGFGATVYGNSSYDNGGDGIDVNQGSLVHGNTAHSNDGFGLRVATLGGYRENVMSGNTAGSVSGAGLNLGANACNGVICP